MSAYMIVYATIKDRNAFINGYAPAAAELVEQFGGRYVFRGGGAEVYEGVIESGRSVVISEWADKASVRRFWDSPEYAEVKKLRDGVCDCDVVVVESPPAQLT